MMQKPYRFRDKEKTKAIFIEAIGSVLKVKGLNCLGVNEISKQAGHNKRLISHHFGNYQNMIDIYISPFGKFNMNDKNDLDEFYLSVGFLIEQGVKDLI